MEQSPDRFERLDPNEQHKGVVLSFSCKFTPLKQRKNNNYRKWNVSFMLSASLRPTTSLRLLFTFMTLGAFSHKSTSEFTNSRRSQLELVNPVHFMDLGQSCSPESVTHVQCMVSM